MGKKKDLAKNFFDPPKAGPSTPSDNTGSPSSQTQFNPPKLFPGPSRTPSTPSTPGSGGGNFIGKTDAKGNPIKGRSNTSSIWAVEKNRWKDTFSDSDFWWRLLLGAFDPIGTKIWSTILGKDLDPYTDPAGGPTDKQLKDARAKGIDTRGAVKGRDVGRAIATIATLGTAAGAMGGGAAGGGAAGAAGAAGGTAGGAGAAASGTALGSTAGVGTGAVLGNSAGLISGGAMGSAIVPVSASGYGTSAALGLGGGTGAAASGVASGSTVGSTTGGGSSFMDQLMEQRPSLGGEDQSGVSSDLVSLMLQMQKDAEERRKLQGEEDAAFQERIRKTPRLRTSRGFF